MKFSIVLFLSYVSSAAATTASPSTSPTTSPSTSPTTSPSNRPSDVPSLTPSLQPSMMPSETPSLMPSETPSLQPSMMPSETPSLQPSSMPSETPSCTPSSAPTPSPSINLFYPDQTSDATGCLNDNGHPGWMDANANIWLFTTLDKCCSTHFAWNYPMCMGTHDETCARALWYPDWEGENKGCLRDGNEPYYMTVNPAGFIFNSKEDCCDEHYSWGKAVCMGGVGGTSISHGQSSITSGDSYYADWVTGDETCKNDGAAPEYMVENDVTWLFDDLDTCCETFFYYKLADCKSEGNRVGTNEWYIDWNTFKCVKDCESGTDCGGFADFYGQSNLFSTKESCCRTHVPYDYKECMK